MEPQVQLPNYYPFSSINEKCVLKPVPIKGRICLVATAEDKSMESHQVVEQYIESARPNIAGQKQLSNTSSSTRRSANREVTVSVSRYPYFVRISNNSIRNLTKCSNEESSDCSNNGKQLRKRWRHLKFAE